MGWDDEDEDGGWTPPLPPEDRLWRHPSEVAALRAVPAVPVHRSSSDRRSWGIALASAVGGALAVGTLWLTLGSPTRTQVTNTAVAVREISATPRLVSAPDWAAAVTDQVAPAVAGVQTAAGTASAVVVRDDGTLVTSTAVVGQARTAVVRLTDGRSLRATVLGTDPSTGIALLRLPAEDVGGLVVAPVAVGTGVQRGDWTAVAGTQAMPLAATVDDIRASTTPSSGATFHGLLRLDVPVPSTALGGAVVDDAGALSGIVAATDGAHAYAVGINEVLAVLDDLDRYGEVRRSWLGVEGSDQVGGGVRLESVDVGGPGALGGLQSGDVVLRIDGQPVAAVADLLTTLRSYRPGDVVPLQVARDGATWTAEIVLGQRPG